jgi:uncharacterized protein (TIGR02145 family)
MKKFYLKIVLVIPVLITAFTLSINAQIHSTSAGGPWDDPTTWIGAVPGATDDVVINGTVGCYANSPTCNNITITSSGVLQNDYYGGTLRVHGNLINNGSINNYSSSFTIYIKGNITNNGTWVNSYTRINGTLAQTVSCLNGNVFGGYQFLMEKASGAFFFDGDIGFENCEVHLANYDVYLQPNSTLSIHDAYINNCTLYGSGESSVVNGIGTFNLDAPQFTNIDFNNCTLTGNINVYPASATHGTVINNGSIQNNYYGANLYIYDDFINNGTIQNYSSNLTVRCYGNLTNNNIIDNYELKFNGDLHQFISLASGKNFSPSYFTVDKSTESVESLTDLSYDNVNVDLNGSTLYMPNNSIFNMDDGRFGDGEIMAIDAAKSGYFTYHCENGATTDNLTLHNATITGHLLCGQQNYFRGSTTNNGLFENDYYGITTYLYDHFTNNGTIQNYSSNLTIEIFGDFTNNSVIENYAMNFKGDTDQYITLFEGEEFSPTYFTSLKPTGDLVAQTDLMFTNTFVNLVDDNLILQDDGTLLLSGGHIDNGNIYDTDSPNGYLHLNFINEAYIANCTVINPELLGKVDINTGNTFIGEILVSDTIRNDYYGYVLNIDGNIINDGVIQNYSSNLTININGNLTNNGIWQNSYTYLNGTTDQHVTCLNGNRFSGYQFFVTNVDAPIHLDTEVSFDNTQVRFEGNNAELPLNSTLLLHGSYLSDCNLHGNGETSVLHGEGEFYVDAPFMQYTTLEDVSLSGDWGLGTTNIWNGTIINNGRIQNNYYSYVVNVYADFINNGTVRSYGNYLTMNMYDNITNNGIWDGQSIDLYGELDQEIFLAEGLTFSPYSFTSLKPSGNTIALTDLTFDNTIVNMDNDPLIMPDNSTLSVMNNYLYRADVSAETDRFYLNLTDEAYIQECVFQDVDLIGLTDVNTLNEFNGTTINYGTLRNDYYTNTANFYGDLINNGTIQNYGNFFIVNAHADIVNNGDWTTYYTQMVGTEDQTVILKNGHPISGQMRFVSDVLASPYQWYWNNWAIENPPYPQPAIISGETSSTLTWISPVNTGWNGTYKCWAGGTYSRNIVINDCSSTMDIAPLSLNFGSQEVSPGTDVLSTFITNNGDCELYIEDLYLSGLQAPYSITNNHLQFLTIQPGQSYEIPVTLNLDYLAGNYNDQLYLSSYNMDNTDINAGVIAYYPFNGNTNDESGNANHGLAKNGAMLDTDRFGNPNSAYYFDGVDDYIEILDATSLRPVDISISGWFNFSTVSGDVRSLIGKTVGSNWQDSFSMWRHNSLKGATGADGQFDEIAYSHTTAQDTWYHIAYTFNDADNTHSLYINGDLVVSGENTLTIGYDSHPLLLGADIENEVLSYFFHGLIDDLRIYNRTISADEVYELYYENQQIPDIVTINVQAELTLTPQVAITAFFEGPFNGTDMNADLNSILPLDQPYNIYPWEYNGGESVTSIPNTDVVDWLLVEFRDAPDAASATSATSLGGQAAFILKDGSIVDLDGSSPILMHYPLADQLFILLWHRNHLPVMSANPLTLIGPTYSYDFTTAASQAYADNQSDMGGIFGMIGGDANGDGTVNENDGIESWYPQVGMAGYLSGDVNMDGEVNNPDKNDTWLPNYGKSEILPGGANSCGSTLIDSRDGQSYTTIEIGTQCWMGENLNIGSMILGTSPSNNNGTIEKYCYGNIEANCATDGGFYTWDEVMNWTTGEGNQGICPEGWHIPSHTEWCTMEQHLDPTVVCDDVAWRGTDIGTQLKVGGSSGFETLLTGGRYWDGTFQNDNVYAYLWTSSASGTAISRHIVTTQPGVYRANNTKTFAFSLRCVKN